jgi:hypothetical protein
MSLTRRQLLAYTIAASVTGVVGSQAPAADALAAASPPGHGLRGVDLETATVAQLAELQRLEEVRVRAGLPVVSDPELTPRDDAVAALVALAEARPRGLIR